MILSVSNNILLPIAEYRRIVLFNNMGKTSRSGGITVKVYEILFERKIYT